MNRDRLRRTGLYASASNPSNMTLAPFYRADFLVYDLEDSVSVAEKDSARFLVFNTLHRPRLTDVELVVRINGLDTPFGLQDLEAIVPYCGYASIGFYFLFIKSQYACILYW